ncbi:alternative ribosome rescue aminoacyl-tRNA hydrolase ArfB [Burkholderiaceae bacterium]|nr:alternative ribosome rescue aminoacyl-tRNA hydrolase ArfB [Burkholderiaceae bacterium]
MTAAAKRPELRIAEDDVEISAIRAQGSGGQNVNKVSSAIHMRFDIAASALPDEVKERLLTLSDSRINKSGVLVIKAQQHRTQEMNKLDALSRLSELVQSVATPPKKRLPTKPSYGSKQRARAEKSQRSEKKALRARISD